MNTTKLSSCLRDHYHTDSYVRRSMKKIREGDSAYLLYDYRIPEDVLKHKPWNQDFLNDLDERVVNGATSEEMYLFMAKVSRHVHIKELIIAVSAAAAILATAVLLIVKVVKN